MQALWMLLAAVMFSLMGLFVKLASQQDITLAQIVLFRGVPSVLLILFWARSARQRVWPTQWRPHLYRNLTGVTAMWLGFYALSHLPLATATSLSYTAPLFIAGWMLAQSGQQRDPVCIASVAVGFLGVLLILRPSIGADDTLPAALGLLGGAFSAVAYMQVRQLGRMGEPEWRTVLLFSLTVSFSSLLGLYTLGWHPLDLQGWLTLIGLGITGMLGQLSMTRAFGLGSALLSAALQYSTIIFAVILGIFFFDTYPDTLAWIGMAGIVLAGLLSVWRTVTHH
ncbi:DMT family transporter [Corticimicrobacter populi]|uniref:EamA domain-containing protein n=1 Tax=Corticimicrobacter populi TaxID=2175229 RepID=A0A2V1K7E6_9BURK|nr:DMT family transporter [Corticimicrobacter populi]PWF25447.1 hypothetical protein DD235_04760 [Corticimicrobacter populi]